MDGETTEARQVAVLLDQQYEDLELWYPVLRLREAGHQPSLIASEPGLYRGKHGLTASPDARVEAVRARDFDALLIPGGYAPDHLRRSEPILALVRELDERGAPIAFICHAGWVLVSAGIVSGRRMTSFFSIRDDLVNAGADWVDEAVVVDGNLISSRGPDDLPVFARTLVEVLARTP
jgi:protease I